MPDLHSQLLLVASVAAGAALVTGIAVRLGFKRALLVQWVPLLAVVSILALAGSAVSHLLLGHGHRSPEPMDPLTFLGEHPTLALVAALALLALGLGRVRVRG